MSISKIVNEIYVPQFDENKNCYIDITPYKPYEKNRIHYSCPCKAGVVFTCNSEYNQHIKSKTHKNYLKNFSIYNKPLDDEKKKTKELKYKNEMLFRKNTKILKAIQFLEPKIKFLKEESFEKDAVISEQNQTILNQHNKIKQIKNDFNNLLKIKDEEIKNLKIIINDINNYEYQPGDFDNDDNTLFYECNLLK